MSQYQKQDFLYEGKAKRLYTTNDANLLWLEFKDDLTAFNAVKKGSFEGKGKANLEISHLIFDYLESHGVETHRVAKISDTESVVKKVRIVPLEVVVRNRAAGSICKRLGFEEGYKFAEPMFEVFYKKDELGDPLLTRENILSLNICGLDKLEIIKGKALKINKHLQGIFLKAGIDLVDFKIEFGQDAEGSILLADEISPDSCRLWDIETKEILDKDRFRKDLGSVKEKYLEILKRLKEVNS